MELENARKFFSVCKPFTKEENDYYIDRYYYRKDLDAKDKLITGNINLIFKVINEHWRSLRDKEDIFALCLSEFGNFIEHYDPKENICLSTYLYSSINRTIMKNYNYNIKHNPEALSLDSAYSADSKVDHFDKNPDNPFGAFIPDPENFVSEVQDKMLCDQLIKEIDEVLHENFSQQKIQIFCHSTGLYGFKKMTFVDIGKKFGLSSERIRIITNEVRRKISAYLKEKHDIKIYDELPEEYFPHFF